MNRREPRKQSKLIRVGLRQLKLRCIGCERVGQTMTQEHVFPRWLIDYAPAKKETIRWIDGRRVPAENATIPICNECNANLG